jgi:hypothetical protein
MGSPEPFKMPAMHNIIIGYMKARGRKEGDAESKSIC